MAGCKSVRSPSLGVTVLRDKHSGASQLHDCWQHVVGFVIQHFLNTPQMLNSFSKTAQV
jgi:hypothetical protein